MSGRLIIFGASGFIGSATLQLLRSEYTIVAPTRQDCDISTQPEELLRLIRPGDVVLNLAACTDVGDVRGCHDVNTVGAKNILNAAVERKAKKIVFAGSALTPINIYAETKLRGEKLHLEQDSIPAVVLVYTNVYGPHDRKGVVAKLIREVAAGEIPEVPSTRRDFVYIRDVVEANRLAVMTLSAGLYFVGSGRQSPISTVLGLIRDELGVGQNDCARLEGAPAPYRHEAFSKVDGWRPRYDLTDGIRETVSEMLSRELSGRSTNLL